MFLSPSPLRRRRARRIVPRPRCQGPGRHGYHVNIPGDFTWKNVNGGGAALEDFKRMAEVEFERIQLNVDLRKECTGAQVLPMYAHYRNQSVIILRLANYTSVEDVEKSDVSTWSVSELTNRLSIVVDADKKHILTLHAHNLDFMKKVHEAHQKADGKMRLDEFVWFVMSKLQKENAMSIGVNKRLFDQRESQFVSAAQSGRRLQGMTKRVYSIMRRSSVNRRVLNETVDVLRAIELEPPKWASGCASDPNFKRLQERMNQSLSFTEEVHASSRDLLGLHFGTAAHRTNDLVSVLTLLNAIFIPLSFMAGFYGMNFEYLPGLGQPIEGVDGVWFLVAAMATVSSCLMLWFRSNGWV